MTRDEENTIVVDRAVESERGSAIAIATGATAAIQTTGDEAAAPPTPKDAVATVAERLAMRRIPRRMELLPLRL